MADANKKVTIIIDGVDNSKDAFKAVEKNMAKTEKSTESLGKSLSSVGKGVTSFGKKMTLFATTPLVAFGVVALKSGAELKGLEESFERLTDIAKISGSEMLTSMQKVSRGTISNKDLILGANKAMSLGVVKNTSEMATIMEIARVKGQNMGLSMEQAFSDLVTGLGRGSAMILDNLGIIIKVGEVNEEYAKSIGKTVQELTSAETKQALVNSVVNKGKAELEAMGEIQTTSKEKMEAFTASLVNLKDELGKQLLPFMEQFVGMAGKWIEKVSALDDSTKKTIVVVGGFVAVLGPLIIVTGLLISNLGVLVTLLGAVFSPVGALIAIFAGLVAVFAILYNKVDFVNRIFKGFIGFLEEKLSLITALKESWQKVVDVFVFGLIPAFKSFFSELEGLKPFLEVFIKVIGVLLYGALIGVVKLIELSVLAAIGALTGAIEFATEVSKAIANVWDSWTTSLSKVVTWIDKAIEKIKSLNILSKASSAIGGFLGFGGERAIGGKVSSGTSYLVGEKGPEMFTPGGNGFITPNDKLGGGGGGIIVNVTGNTLMDRQAGEKIGNQIIKKLKLVTNI